MADGREVFEKVLDLARRARQERRETDVGAVFGLTHAGEELLEKVDDIPLLIPGLGAQGGELGGLANCGRRAPLLINVSRGIAYRKPELSYGEKARFFAEQIRDILAIE